MLNNAKQIENARTPSGVRLLIVRRGAVCDVYARGRGKILRNFKGDAAQAVDAAAKRLAWDAVAEPARRRT